MAADLAGWVDRWADHRRDSLAIEFEGRTTSYGQLAERIGEAAAWLADLGIAHGDRVAYLGPNRPEAIELVLACSWLGAIYLPLNSRLAPAEHDWILADAEPAIVVEDPTFTEHLDSLSLLCPRAVLTADQHDYRTDPNPTPPPRIGTSSDPVLLAYTSGTTGRPKGALLDQRALLTNAVNGAHAHDLTSADRVLTLLPLFHVGGLNIQTLPTLHAGGAVLLHRAFDPGLWLEDVERWQPTLSLLVPATLLAVSSHPRFEATDLGALRGLMTGSSTVPEAILRPFLDRGIPVGQIYGSTETAPTALYLRFEDSFDHPRSCGKPATHCEIRIVGPDGIDVPAGQGGELWVKGENILREYWRNPEATAEAIVDGWFRTGDIGHVEDEFFHIDDRSKDVIISGGENVYPAELENVLADYDQLAEAAVIGQPDELWGEVPLVVAVAAPGATRDDQAVFDLFNGRLARFKHPKGIRWVDSLPHNAMGKVQKHILRAQL